MARIKASNRPRRHDEDVVSWAVRTGRIMASSADSYRARLEHNEINEQFVEALYPAMAGSYVEDVRAAGRSGPVSIVSRHPAQNRDAYAANPIVDRLASSHPAEFRAASLVKQPPKLFGINHDRDLPIVMASGMDPSILLEIPWQARHRIAAEPNPAKVYHLLEAFANDPVLAEYEYGANSGADIVGQDPSDVEARTANRMYEQACFKWAVGPPDEPKPINEREYQQLFPESS